MEPDEHVNVKNPLEEVNELEVSVFEIDVEDSRRNARSETERKRKKDERRQEEERRKKRAQRFFSGSSSSSSSSPVQQPSQQRLQVAASSPPSNTGPSPALPAPTTPPVLPSAP